MPLQIFVLLVSIILMNLLVGLAVSDIQESYNIIKINLISVNIISKMKSLGPSKVRRTGPFGATD